MVLGGERRCEQAHAGDRQAPARITADRRQQLNVDDSRGTDAVLRADVGRLDESESRNALARTRGGRYGRESTLPKGDGPSSDPPVLPIALRDLSRLGVS